MKDKSGVSPVLATLLLIVITVAAAIIVYAWTTTFATMQTGRTGTLILVENVNLTKADDYRNKAYDDVYKYKFAVTVRNIGSTEVTIVEVYLNGTKMKFETQTVTGPSATNLNEGEWGMKETAISPGAAGYVYVHTWPLRKGYLCTIRVVTGQGAYSDTSFYPP